MYLTPDFEKNLILVSQLRICNCKQKINIPRLTEDISKKNMTKVNGMNKQKMTKVYGMNKHATFDGG